eukprot:579371-Rhodomonas_salina.1
MSGIKLVRLHDAAACPEMTRVFDVVRCLVPSAAKGTDRLLRFEAGDGCQVHFPGSSSVGSSPATF